MLPIFDVVLTHTVGITDVTVLSDTFNIDPDIESDPLYLWDYTQTYADVVVTRTFQSRLDEMLPGETRLVAQGTEVAYVLPSGTKC